MDKNNYGIYGRRCRFVRFAPAMAAVMLAACSAPADTKPAPETETSVISSAQTEISAAEAAAETKQDETSSPSPEEAATEQISSVTEKPVYDYVHGEEGYYNLLENGVEFELVPQLSGTCWVCAAACAMTTGYQMDHEGTVVFDQMELVDKIYDNDKDEGIFIAEGIDKADYGGISTYVVNELGLGYKDGIVLDHAVYANDWSADEIKEGIQKYGALFIGIPDTDRSKKRYFGDYYTMNFPDAKEDDFDHSIAVIGWDDNFPKEYFSDKASRDGAWITYNSNFSKGYYYVSYDTPFHDTYDPPIFMSVTDEYSKVLSHDRGCWSAEPVITGETTTAANVFKGEGTLAAVGFYSLADDQDITVRILTPDLSECVYSQEYHTDRGGYHVMKLDEPLQVDEYAVSVSCPEGIYVEGEPMKIDYALSIGIVSESGQSFILIGDEWMDMSKEETWEQCGCVTNNACIRALYTE